MGHLCVCVHTKTLQSCPTLCDPMHYNLPRSSLQARILEWLSCPPQGIFLTQVSNLGLLHCRQILYHWITREAQDTSFRSDQIRLVGQSCPTLCDPMNRSTPGLPVHHQLLEFTQTHIHRVSDAIQPFDPLSSPSPPALNPSQHQSLFQWVNSLHEVAKVLEFQL